MEEWVRIVRAMQRITVDKSGVPSEPSDFERKDSDAWERYNEERDSLIADILTEI